MKQSRPTEKQMVKIMREADQPPVIRVAKRRGISGQTMHLWRKRSGRLEPVDVKWLGAVEAENAGLRSY